MTNSGLRNLFALLPSAMCFAATLVASKPALGQACPGDCNDDHIVTSAELVTGVNIGLGRLPASACTAFDPDLDGTVGVVDLVEGVQSSLDGCPEEATPTASPTPPIGATATSTATASPTQAASATATATQPEQTSTPSAISSATATPTATATSASTATATPTITAQPGFASIGGQVVDVDGFAPLAGVIVTSGDLSTATDANGFYSFEGLPAGTVILGYEKTGYAASTKRLEVSPEENLIVGVMLKRAGAEQSLDPTQDETLVEGDSRLTVRANTLRKANGEAVDGPVDVVITKADVATGDVLSFPGSFEMAVDQDGAGVQLETFGFATYHLTQNGEEVDLAPGETATIEFVLPDNAQDLFQIDDTIPLWDFEVETGLWREIDPPGVIRAASDGSGKKAWVAEVPHFSSWNADRPITEKQAVSGTVREGGDPIRGVEITAVGLSYNGTSSGHTDAQGRFCVDVKRGSTVTLQVRVNGAATPLRTRMVSVPDTEASCATGGGVELGEPLEIDFTSCVRGRVTDGSGAPVAGTEVFVVPGVTATTDAQGMFCSRAPGNETVYAFAAGQLSVQVATPETATCAAGTCAEVSLGFALPRDGDHVGAASASKTTAIQFPIFPIPGFDPVTRTFNLGGQFFVVDLRSVSDLELEGLTVTNETIGDCNVNTIEFTSVIDPDDPDAMPVPPPGFVALDPGDPGRADNGTVAVDLLRGDPAQFDPPLPFVSGLFSPLEEDLLGLGFDAGQTIELSWPGGADLGAFTDAVAVPAEIVLLSPNLEDPNFTIQAGAPISATWTPNPTATGLFTISVASSESSFSERPDGRLDVSTTTVTVSCAFQDSAGTGTISGDLTGRLAADALFQSFTVARIASAETEVPLLRTGGMGIVELSGQTSISRNILNIGFPLPFAARPPLR